MSLPDGILSTPPEIILVILESCDICSIHALQATSKFWYDLINAHEATVYRAAAALHGFGTPRGHINESKGVHFSPWLDRVETWKSLCQRHLALQRSWAGSGETSSGIVHAAGNMAHRVKIDEKERTIITTSTRDLRVASLNGNDGQGELLWALGPNHMRLYPHCEFDHGFLIFDQEGDALEVWRRKSDQDSSPLPTPTIETRQVNAAARTAQEFARNGGASSSRGVFVPFGMLKQPHHTRAYRFVYPTLLVASQNPPEAYLWDIPSCKLIQTIELAPPNEHDAFLINYVEVSQGHVFVCQHENLFIYSRQSGKQVLAISPSTLSPRSMFYSLSDPPIQDPPGRSMVAIPVQPLQYTHPHILSFVAAHVSPCGRDLVAVTDNGLFFFVPGFQRAIDGSVRLGDIAICLDVQAVISNMTYDGKRAVVTTSLGTFCINLPAPGSTLFGDIHWLTCLPLKSNQPPEDIDDVSCVQMTKTGIFIVAPEEDTGFQRVHFMDFSAPWSSQETMEVDDS